MGAKERALKRDDYREAFEQYVSARDRYEEVQTRIFNFLSRFTGRSGVAEQPFEVEDLEDMNWLRAERDVAFREYRDREKAVFQRLGEAWEEQGLGDRFRVTRQREEPQG